MKHKRIADIAIRATAAGAVATMLGGVALAADTVSVSTTGSGSNQQTTINNTTSSDVSTTNDIQVSNVNVQQAQTGDVTVADNTAVGGVTSGNASNAAQTSTVIGLSTGGAGGAGSSDGLPTGGSGSGGGSGNGGTGAAGGRGGGVLGAATGGLGGGAMLPEVGALVPVDLSGLSRSFTPTASKTPVAGTNGFSLGLLVPALLLSVLAGVGGYVNDKRRQILKG